MNKCPNKIEISPDEILYIQRQIEYGLDETKFIGKIKSPNSESPLDCYHGVYRGIEYFALCVEGESFIVTFLNSFRY